MNKNLTYLVALFFFSICTLAKAQQPVEEWARKYNSTASTTDDPLNLKIITTDNEGNTYVTGTITNYNTSEQKIVTIKLSPSGDELWMKEYDNGSYLEALGIAVDNRGGVYVTTIHVTIRYDAATGALSWETPHAFNASAITIDGQGNIYISGSFYSNDSGLDYATARYDAATGSKVWESRYNGDANDSDFATSIAVDNAGGVYVTGESYNASWGSDYATVRYDAATGDQTWASRYSMGGYFGNSYLVADPQGGIYVTGTTYSSSTGYDITTIRYNAANGNEDWSDTFNQGGSEPDWAADIAIDSESSVYVTGLSGGAYSDANFTTIRFDKATGERKWVSAYSGEDNDWDQPRSIAVDNKGSVFVTGTSQKEENSYTFTTILYNSATGNPVWVQEFSGMDNGWDEVRGMAIDNLGGVYITGRDETSQTGSDIVIIRYDAASSEMAWQKRYDFIGNQRDHGVAVAVDAEGNSYVAGTSDNSNSRAAEIILIKYSPDGDELWQNVYDKGIQNVVSAVVLDGKGGVYISGRVDGDYLTMRFDAETGDQSWERRFNGAYNSWDEAVAIAVDAAGAVYVTGTSKTGESSATFVTISYDAATGQQKWLSLHNNESGSYNRAAALAIDGKGRVYVTGSGNGNFLTIGYDATSGQEKWATSYNSEIDDFEGATAIAVDDQGNVFVTGSSSGIDTYKDYVTIRYDGESGQQVWLSRYDGAKDGYDFAADIAVDNKGSVYVTGRSQSIGGDEVEYEFDFATVRYDAATGEEKWVSRFNDIVYDYATAIAVDSLGGVYVTGYSGSYYDTGVYNTLKYNAADGVQLWKVQSTGTEEVALDLALDGEGNVFVTGYSRGAETGPDVYTIKYSQNQCPALADAAIQGGTTVRSNTDGAVFSLAGSDASSFIWSITGSNGTAFSNFTRQGTSSISVNWSDSPGFYKVMVTYGGQAACPTRDTTLYVHVFDEEAGFVTGGGWSVSPDNLMYEFMQQESKAHWSLNTKYKKGDDNTLQGGTSFRLESESFIFRSTSLEARTLVIDGNMAFYRGEGQVSYINEAGVVVSDPRRFSFLISAMDGDFDGTKAQDRLRILVWELKADGSRGAVVYDNQPTCSDNLDENAPPCEAIRGGNIVIHAPNMKASKKNAVLASIGETKGQALTAYPNAFSDYTTLAFSLDEGTGYSLALYDMKGVLVKQIAEGTAKAGQHHELELRADGLPTGVYLARLATGSKVQTVKVVVRR